MHITRKTFLWGSLSAGVLALSPLWAVRRVLAPRKAGILVRRKSLIRPKNPDKILHLYNTHTGESVKACVFAEGRWQRSELKVVQRLCRDHRTNQEHPIDIRLIELMNRLVKLLSYQKPLQIVSAYRSPRTNAMLRRAGRQVGKHSYHLSGKAVDIAFSGLTLQRAYKAACYMGAGGVGYYPSSRFVHMDVRGSKITWQGA